MTELKISTDDFATEPLKYPGEPPESSTLLIDHVWHELRPRPGRRLGQAEVLILDGNPDTLNASLLDANVTPVGQRTLVVSIGSNSSMAVMRRKFFNAGVSTTLPFIKATLAGISIGHSAHVSRPGYIAAAPYAMPGAFTPVFASLLDEEQLACLDATEPNYKRHLLQAADYQLDLGRRGQSHPAELVEQPARFHLYMSRFGLICPPDADTMPLTNQEDLFHLLIKRGGPLHDLFADMEPTHVVQKLAADQLLREEVKELLRRKWARVHGIIATCTASADCGADRYDDSESAWIEDRPSRGLVCRRSSDLIDRAGAQCIVMNPHDKAERNIGAHAAVRVAALLDGDQRANNGEDTEDEGRSGVGTPVQKAKRKNRPGVVTVVIADNKQPLGTIGVDQVIRNGLGIEIYEYLIVDPAIVEPTPVADRLISRPHYSLLRVQTADLATVEQNVALMSPLAMSILGLESGDEVLIEGAPRSDHTDRKVSQLRLKAHAAPDETVERRVALAGGGLSSRFPSTRSALGVHPDLPWVFLDSAARKRLNLEDDKLGAVRVRASRRFQVARELRELLLLLVLAVVGLASVVESRMFLLVGLGVLLAAAVVVLRHRLRNRLGSGG